MGGAQAIAALAFGTESVQAVDVIVGPGNPYVQEAKRQVVGQVGIDGIAGPSELVVVAAGAGGHAGQINPIALVNEIRAIYDGPLALSGCISHGKDILAAQVMGCDFA